jgi:hypothetical protein
LIRDGRFHIVGAVLLLRHKTLLIHGRAVKLYSVDGKTWFFKARDYTEFKRRRGSRKGKLSKMVSVCRLGALSMIHSFGVTREVE